MHHKLNQSRLDVDGIDHDAVDWINHEGEAIDWTMMVQMESIVMIEHKIIIDPICIFITMIGPILNHDR